MLHQHVLFFELTIIVNCQVSLNLRLQLIQNTLSQAISEKEKKKIILLGLDLNRELPGAGRNG